MALIMCVKRESREAEIKNPRTPTLKGTGQEEKPFSKCEEPCSKVGKRSSWSKSQ